MNVVLPRRLRKAASQTSLIFLLVIIFLWLIDTINLFIHEAGHFFFRILGQWMHVLGGTALPVPRPARPLLVVVWRQNIGQIWYPGFWLGESLVNASAYIQDAPYRKLKLIASGLIHDWLVAPGRGAPDAACIGGTVYWLGILLLHRSPGRVSFAIRDYREDRVYVSPPRLTPLPFLPLLRREISRMLLKLAYF